MQEALSATEARQRKDYFGGRPPEYPTPRPPGGPALPDPDTALWLPEAVPQRTRIVTKRPESSSPPRNPGIPRSLACGRVPHVEGAARRLLLRYWIVDFHFEQVPFLLTFEFFLAAATMIPLCFPLSFSKGLNDAALHQAI